MRFDKDACKREARIQFIDEEICQNLTIICSPDWHLYCFKIPE